MSADLHSHQLDHGARVSLCDSILRTRTSIDYAELDPAIHGLSGRWKSDGKPGDTKLRFTYSGGTSETAWFAASVDPPGYTDGGGTVAAAANASRSCGILPAWRRSIPLPTAVAGQPPRALPREGVIASDRVNPCSSTDYAAGQFYVSTNGGVSFSATAATGLPAYRATRCKHQSCAWNRRRCLARGRQHCQRRLRHVAFDQLAAPVLPN
jgi:hypothetical protein